MRPRRSHTRIAPLTVLLLLAAASPATAEVVLDGSIRARETVYLNHDFDPSAAANNFATLRTRIGVAATVGEYASAFVELQDSRVFGEPRNTVTSLEQVDLHQGYIHIHNAFNTSLEFKIGRQELSYGDDRQIGLDDWSDVGRSFDGLVAMYDVEDVGWLHVFGTKTLETDGILPGVNDGDGVTREPGAPDAESAFVGTYLHLEIATASQVEAYLFDLYEDLPTLLDENQQAIVDPNGHRFTVGGRWRWRGETPAAPALGAEAAYQFGTGPETAPDGIATAGPDIAAYAFTAFARAGLGHGGMWIAGQFDFASGDSRPGEADDETYRQLFPSAHPVLGSMDFVGWRNLLAWQLQLGLAPSPAWELAATFSVFGLAEPADTWYAADGLPFDPDLAGHEAFDTALGRELDLRVTFAPEPGLRFGAVAGLWWPGAWQEQASALRDGAGLDDALDHPPRLDVATSLFLFTSVSW